MNTLQPSHMNAHWRSTRRNMFKVLASLLLFLVLYCRTTVEELDSNCPQRSCNGTTAAGPPPTPPSGLPRLPQQEVDAVNTLLHLATTSLSEQIGQNTYPPNMTKISASQCHSRKFMECRCNTSTNTCWVTKIDLHESQLSGPIPKEIGDLAYLKSL
ncbi:uncharacterized protein LOC113757969 [Coffea eugenioides]|uniref:uncharacterized protein LOC113757969 n=1 Tax=Coffea eugenioides TaxID=49369 RepID=UPI000F610929|nr:uncharacterized protein LOC113757969 [Coffea eugenioides]